jgi:hypothetical protein
MRSCFIMGSGRSGTSLIAGVMANSGYYMGDNYIPPRESNPKGFFEDREINAINEYLISRVVLNRPWFIPKPVKAWTFRDRPMDWQRWLAIVPLNSVIPSPPNIIARINKVIQKKPYCYKDPRFCYTLPVWRPLVTDTIFICIFRSPPITATSILKDCRDTPYLKNLKMDFNRATELWIMMYKHVLEKHRFTGEWLFIHYEQLFTQEGLKRIEDFSGANVNHSFPDPALRRSVSNLPVQKSAQLTYQELCSLANYQDG